MIYGQHNFIPKAEKREREEEEGKESGKERGGKGKRKYTMIHKIS